MRIIHLAVLASALTGALVYFGTRPSQETGLSAALPEGQELVAAEALEPALSEEEPADLVSASVLPGPDQVAAPAGPRTLDGTVRDRFDQPMGGERVWLLSPENGHPAESAALSDYITGTTTSSGAFSLTLPGGGSYRLAVGAPGAPRIPPSDPFETTGLPRAEVTIPGGTSVHVTFDEVPASEEPIVLEVMTLREGDGGRGDRGGGEGRDRGARRGERDAGGGRGGRRGQQGDRGERTQRDRGEDAGEGRRRGGRGGEEGGNARQVAFVQDGQRREVAGDQDADEQEDAEGLGDQASRPNREGGQDRAQRPVLERETWRAALRHTLTEEELAGGVVKLVGLPAGREARLDLRMGRRRIEGLGRFHVAADIRLALRVLPLPQDPQAGLGYLISSSPIGPNAPAAGVRWKR